MKRQPSRILGTALTTLSALKFTLDQLGRWETLVSLKSVIPFLGSPLSTVALFVAGIGALFWADWSSQRNRNRVGLLDSRGKTIEVKRNLIGRDAVFSVVAGLAAGGLIAMTFWLHDRELSKRGHIHIQSFTPLPLKAGEPVRVNFQYVNNGNSPVVFETSGVVHFEPVLPTGDQEAEDVIENMMSSHVRAIAQQPHSFPTTLNPGVKVWSTLTGPVLDQAHIDGLKYNSALFALGILRYVDHSRPDVEFCIHWQDTGVVMLCKSHNLE